MADATEGLLHLNPTAASLSEDGPQDPTAHTSDSDSDNDDLPPDFLNLTRTTKDKKSKTGAPPKRGTKDFETNQTRLQSRTLDASRQAMWEALGVTRVHHPTTFKTEKRRVKRRPSDTARRRKETTGLETPLASDIGSDTEEEFKVSSTSGTPIGIYDSSTGQTHISAQHRRGKLFDSIGRDQSGGGVDLNPEEALWALEGSKLDVRYPRNYFDDYGDTASEDGNDSDSEAEEMRAANDSGIPLSLQGAYAAYIGSETSRGGRLTLEKYQVYAALKRLGYIVQRAPEWDGPGLNQVLEPFRPQTLSRSSTATGSDITSDSQRGSAGESTLRRLQGILLGSKLDATLETEEQKHSRQAAGPLVTPGLYRSYADIFRLLALVPSSDPTTTPAPVPPRIVVSHHRDSSTSRSVTLGGVLSRSASPAPSRRLSMVGLDPSMNGGLNGDGKSRRNSTTTLLESGTMDMKIGGTPVREQVIDDEDGGLHTFRTVWNVWKPAGSKVAAGEAKVGAGAGETKAAADNAKAPSTAPTRFRKSAPPLPDFRICVVSARETSVPTLAQMEALYGEQTLQPPPPATPFKQPSDATPLSFWSKPFGKAAAKDTRPEPINHIYRRLQHGYKNVILAVVDEGTVSYVRLADAGFSREKLFERRDWQGVAGVGSPGGKGGGGRGGRGGGRGRGRGRGRG